MASPVESIQQHIVKAFPFLFRQVVPQRGKRHFHESHCDNAAVLPRIPFPEIALEHQIVRVHGLDRLRQKRAAGFRQLCAPGLSFDERTAPFQQALADKLFHGREMGQDGGSGNSETASGFLGASFLDLYEECPQILHVHVRHIPALRMASRPSIWRHRDDIAP